MKTETMVYCGLLPAVLFVIGLSIFLTYEGKEAVIGVIVGTMSAIGLLIFGLCHGNRYGW